MPVSRVELIEPVVNAVRECDRLYGVKTILDVGCGTGFYGAALRQYLDFAYNRITDSEIEIQGIEPHSDYSNPNWKHYTQIMGGKIQEYLQQPHAEDFDVILACDVLEHMELEEAESIAKELYKRTEKYLIITTPSSFREQWQPEGKPWENPLEEHKCFISPEMIEAWFPRVRIQELGSVYIAVVAQEFLPV